MSVTIESLTAELAAARARIEHLEHALTVVGNLACRCGFPAGHPVEFRRRRKGVRYDDQPYDPWKKVEGFKGNDHGDLLRFLAGGSLKSFKLTEDRGVSPPIWECTNGYQYRYVEWEIPF